MIKGVIFSCLVCGLLSLNTTAQEAIEVTGSIQSRVFLAAEELPFWMFTNTQGFIGERSDFGASAFAKADYTIKKHHNLSLGLGGYLSNGFENDFRRSDLYLEYTNTWFAITAGAKQVAQTREGLSTINDDILFTGNVRPIPGVLLSTQKPIRLFSKFSVSGEIAHYDLNDDRLTRGARIHYKRFTMHWKVNDQSSFSVGLRHYVQWGGIFGDGVALPDDLNAFVNVFVGANGGDIDNPNEAINALGNHLGSYQINYKRPLGSGQLELYHQTLFEDRSGRELNNFPDGVWGAFYTFKKTSILKNVLYEYVQTVSQSGSPSFAQGFDQQSGGDNYFSNSIYRSGWTYEGQTIGLPFINPVASEGNPINNRSIAHHLGALAQIDGFAFKGKLTYLENLGAFSAPFENRQKQLLSYLETQYTTKKWGSILLYSGIDLLNDASSKVAIGLGYQYLLN